MNVFFFFRGVLLKVLTTLGVSYGPCWPPGQEFLERAIVEKNLGIRRKIYACFAHFPQAIVDLKSARF